MKQLIIFILILLAGVCTAEEPDSLYVRYSQLLSEYVSEEGLVDYVGLSERDLAIKGILSGLSEFEQSNLEGENQNIAFWLNVYNLLVLESVVDNYPIKSSMLKGIIYPANSIRHVPNVFARKVFPAGEDMLSLDDIEHRILRQDFDDPRIHFALVCGAMDCPPLRRSLYMGDSLDTQLTEQAKLFLGRERNFQVEEQVIVLSEIFSWFGEDFTEYAPDGGIQGLSPIEAGFMGYIASVMPEYRDFILKGGYRISYTDYSWALNAWKR